MPERRGWGRVRPCLRGRRPARADQTGGMPGAAWVRIAGSWVMADPGAPPEPGGRWSAVTGNVRTDRSPQAMGWVCRVRGRARPALGWIRVGARRRPCPRGRPAGSRPARSGPGARMWLTPAAGERCAAARQRGRQPPQMSTGRRPGARCDRWVMQVPAIGMQSGHRPRARRPASTEGPLPPTLAVLPARAVQ